MQHHFHIKFNSIIIYFFRRNKILNDATLNEYTGLVKVTRMVKLLSHGSSGERQGKGGWRAWEAEGYQRFLSQRLNRSSCSKRQGLGVFAFELLDFVHD